MGPVGERPAGFAGVFSAVGLCVDDFPSVGGEPIGAYHGFRIFQSVVVVEFSCGAAKEGSEVTLVSLCCTQMSQDANIVLAPLG